MTEPSLRIKVTDFLATDFEQEVFQELMKLKQLEYMSGVSFPLYFWYDRESEIVDLNVLEPFIKYWKTSGEYRTKLILIPELTDMLISSCVSFFWVISTFSSILKPSSIISLIVIP